MKKIYTILLLSLLLLSGCGEKESSEPVQKINEITPPTVADIPLLEKDLYLPENEKSEKKLVFRGNVTQEDEITFLYEYQTGKKLEFQLARLQPDDTWEVSKPKWGKALLKETSDPLSAISVYSDGSYLAMIQPENDLPLFYHLMPDGTVTKWELPDGILEWEDGFHEITDGMFLTEQNQILLTTYKIEVDESSGKPFEGLGPETGRLLIYDPYTKKLVSERDYVGMAGNIFITDKYVFCSRDSEIQAYLLDGGGIQSVYKDKELEKAAEKNSPVAPFCTYSGGKYAYWYTELGIYRFDVSLADKPENTVEKIISSEYYPKTDKEYFGVNQMICNEDGNTTTIYVRGLPYSLKTDDEEDVHVDAAEQIFTRYVLR